MNNINAFGKNEAETALLFRGVSPLSKLSRRSYENIIEEQKLPYMKMHGLDMA